MKNTALNPPTIPVTLALDLLVLGVGVLVGVLVRPCLTMGAWG